MLYDLPLNRCANVIIIIFYTILLAPAWQSNFITEVPANTSCYHREWYWSSITYATKWKPRTCSRRGPAWSICSYTV